MRAILITFFLGMICISMSAQISNPNYDEDLAASLGADDYGMKTYVFVVLQSGDNKSEDAEFRNKCFRGHMENMGRLAKDKKLIVAGPMFENEHDYRGIFIFDVDNLEDAKKLVETDPAIQNDFLKPVMFLWYGSAALPLFLPESDKVWKIKP